MAATANASSLHNVFVYGTLMADEVVRTILKRVPPASPAVLNDYHRFSIKGRVYPAILPAESKKVKGRDKSEKLLANAYVWSDKNDPNLYSEWDFEEWKRLHKKDFVTMTLGFMDDLEQPDSKTRVATYESYFHQGQSA
ncbi:AIG2-like protein D isoform X2 [Musa acuminata AAA Group]|uniref:AIG2-like protein D isoform X2 n=1 Tax=Musa acuminata AAA Group TaxID=214697 RepID=UPI0031D2D422